MAGMWHVVDWHGMSYACRMSFVQYKAMSIYRYFDMARQLLTKELEEFFFLLRYHDWMDS